ncbi:hypothetical protein Scep_007156 [Stephania cephalantha]|uniref:Uncharacterized protein n=1 Tax=Stephania cephalantha TaxID=152367 RepID=A0AAP0KBC1_9MAGN
MTQSQLAYPHVHSTTHHHHFLISFTSLSPTYTTHTPDTHTHKPRGRRRNREEEEEEKEELGRREERVEKREGGESFTFVVVYCVGHGGREWGSAMEVEPSQWRWRGCLPRHRVHRGWGGEQP